MKLSLLKTCYFISAVLLAKASFLHADPVELLANQMADINTITANFEQKIYDNKGRILQEAHGTLKVKRPRQLHWLTRNPYEHLVVTDGKTLWLYDIDLEQVNQEPFSEDLDRAPALLLSGNVDAIAKNYKVELLSNDGEGVRFKLIPQKQDSLFIGLEITFADKKIRSMMMADSFDQVTTIDFNEVSVNLAIDDQLFQFIVPEGVDLIANER